MQQQPVIGTQVPQTTADLQQQQPVITQQTEAPAATPPATPQTTPPPPQITLPTPQEMQSQLRTSGVLNAQTDFSQLSQQEQQNQPHIQLAESAKDEPIIEIDGQLSWFKKYVPKTVGFLLMLQGLYGIYQSVIFILVEFPQLEVQLQEHHITSGQINTFASKAVITVVSTVISMIFAMRLTFLKTKAAKVLNTGIGLVIFFGNATISQYLSSLDTGSIISGYSVSMLEFIFLQLQKVLSIL